MQNPNLEYLQFTDEIRICRILNGMWQVSGAHGKIDPIKAVDEMFTYVENGFITWDLADHYGPAEDFVGDFRRKFIAKFGKESLSKIKFFTKWVPRAELMTRRLVERSIDRSLRRMDVDSLDLLQFHWWDYNDDNYLRALEYLASLSEEGKIKNLALTNFDTEHLEIIIKHGIKIVSNQVQFSLIDLRPMVKMVDFCQKNNIWLLPYGTLCGGFISEKYIGQNEPGYFQLETVSLKKYLRMIDAWGGWQLFQELLTTLNKIAKKYNVSLSNIATRYILDIPVVAGVIIGTRLGLSENIKDNIKTFSFALDQQDKIEIQQVLAKANNVYLAIGDCGDEYRKA